MDLFKEFSTLNKEECQLLFQNSPINDETRLKLIGYDGYDFCFNLHDVFEEAEILAVHEQNTVKKYIHKLIEDQLKIILNFEEKNIVFNIENDREYTVGRLIAELKKITKSESDLCIKSQSSNEILSESIKLVDKIFNDPSKYRYLKVASFGSRAKSKTNYESAANQPKQKSKQLKQTPTFSKNLLQTESSEAILAHKKHEKHPEKPQETSNFPQKNSKKPKEKGKIPQQNANKLVLPLTVKNLNFDKITNNTNNINNVEIYLNNKANFKGKNAGNLAVGLGALERREGDFERCVTQISGNEKIKKMYPNLKSESSGKSSNFTHNNMTGVLYSSREYNKKTLTEDEEMNNFNKSMPHTNSIENPSGSYVKPLNLKMSNNNNPILYQYTQGIKKN